MLRKFAEKGNNPNIYIVEGIIISKREIILLSTTKQGSFEHLCLATV